MPRTDFSIKQGDTQPSIEATLLSDGDPVNLEQAAVLFDMDHTSEDVRITGLCTVQDVDGEVAYIWKDGDTDIEGTYEAEFLIDYTLPESVSEFEKDETFPPERFLRIEINESL